MERMEHVPEERFPSEQILAERIAADSILAEQIEKLLAVKSEIVYDTQV